MAEAGETVTQDVGGSWYAPAEAVLKQSEPEVWQHFENGVKSGGHKDLPTLIKNHVNLEKRLGSALVPPGKDAKPEEIKAFTEKIYGTGIIKPPAAIPESPDKYELKLDSIPEDMRDQEFISGFRKLAHEEGIPQKAVDRLVEAYGQQFGKSMQLFKNSATAAEARLREKVKAEGRTYEEAIASGERAMTHFLQESPKELEIFNQVYGNHPSILYMFSKIGDLVGEDSSFLGGNGDGSVDSEFNAAKEIMDNPQHPDHAAWRAEHGKGPVSDKITKAYAKKFPGKFNLT